MAAAGLYFQPMVLATPAGGISWASVMSVTAVLSRVRLLETLASAVAVGPSAADAASAGLASAAAMLPVGPGSLGVAACCDPVAGLDVADAEPGCDVALFVPAFVVLLPLPAAVDVEADAAPLAAVCADAEAAGSAACAEDALPAGALAVSPGAEAALLIVGVEGVTACEPDVVDAPPPPPPQPTTSAQQVRRTAMAGRANV